MRIQAASEGTVEPIEIATDVVFDPGWYRRYYPDVDREIRDGRWLDALGHYRLVGAAQGRSPNPLFDETMVRVEDRALAAAIVDGEFVSAVDHYAQFGARETRRVSRWVDGEWYRRTYPEVQEALDQGSEPDAYRFFLHDGVGAGHIPTPRFDPSAYRAAIRAGVDLPPLEGSSGPFEHFLQYGLPAGIEAGAWEMGHELGSPLSSLSRRRLERFLASGRSLDVPTSSQPIVSVVIPVGNQGGFLLDCLQSLLAEGRGLEVVLVERSPDAALRSLLERVDGAMVVWDCSHLALVEALNRAVQRSRGRNLLFLDGESALESGSIEAALEALNADTRVAVVGGRVIGADGGLASAGLSMTRQGRPVAWGRSEAPFGSLYSHRREVPIVSPDFLLADREVFCRVGGFDSTLRTLSMAAADFCLRNWRAERHTVVEPGAIVWRRGDTTEESALQQAWRERDEILVAARHSDLLSEAESRARHPWQGAPLVEATRGRRMLYCDDRAPVVAMGSGYPRARDLLWILHRLGWRVTLLPLLGGGAAAEGIRTDLPPTLEILDAASSGTLESLLETRPGHFEVVWASRPASMEPVARLASDRPELLTGCRVVYDVEALFALREERRPSDAAVGRAEATSLAEEISLASRADVVVAASRVERRWLEEQGLATHWLGYSPNSQVAGPDFEPRSGILMVAAVHSTDSPNYDGLDWFLREVWPSLLAEEPCLRLHVVGYWEVGVLRPEVEAPGVVWHGPVDDLEPHYQSARLFVAPTRYGSGIPLKILDAAAHGLPVATTDPMAQALEWSIGEDLVAAPATAPRTLADEILRVYRDAELWRSLRRSALVRIQDQYSATAFEDAVREVLRAVGSQASAESPCHRLLTACPEDWLSLPEVDAPWPVGGRERRADLPEPLGVRRQAWRRLREFEAAAETETETETETEAETECEAGAGSAARRSNRRGGRPSLAADCESPWQSSGGLPTPVRWTDGSKGIEADTAILGGSLPDFSHRGLSRWPARWMARVVLFVTRFLTVPQQRLNQELRESVCRLGRSLEAFSVETSDALAACCADIERLASAGSKGRSSLELRLQSARSDLARIGSRLAVQEEEFMAELSRRWFSSPRTPVGGSVAQGDQGRVGALYSALQERFRGSRELVRQRVEEYLPRVAAQPPSIAPLAWLDVGCGRGEWVEALAENGVAVQGVDEDPGAAECCRKLQLPVVRGEALAYLRTLECGTFRGVSALHVIEHWRVDRIVTFLEETRRVLAPGGILLLETPNPHNLVTSALDFHYDPTHQRPIPPALLVFLLEEAGFSQVSPQPLTAHRDVRPIDRVPESANGLGECLGRLVETVNTNLLSPPDYSVVALRGTDP